MAQQATQGAQQAAEAERLRKEEAAAAALAVAQSFVRAVIAARSTGAEA